MFKGNISGGIHDELVEKKIDYFGYILLDSQILKDDETDSLVRERFAGGAHKRGPLKGRKEISLKNSRFIPIDDKKCWNILVKLYQKQKEVLKKGTFGLSDRNYLFFEDLEQGTVRRHMASVNEEKKSHKDFHSLRHTYSTNLVGKTRSFFLAKAVLGHKSEKEFEKYCHLAEQTQLNAQKNSQSIDFVS